MLIAGPDPALVRPAGRRRGKSRVPRPVAGLAIALAAALLAGLAAGCGGDGASPAGGGPGGAGPRTERYYLALGDSLAVGVEPGPSGVRIPTGHGYPDQLAAMLRLRDPRLRLVKLGCPGETTGTMISGRHCHYPAGSQLAAAVAFLRAHRGRVKLVTIDIGANDPGSCFTLPVNVPVPPCTAGPALATVVNLTRILTRVRAAAGRRVTIIGMSYYAPELPEWRLGAAGRRAARSSARTTLAYDRMLARAFASAGDRVADVAGAFATADFAGQARLPRLGLVPDSVAAVCRWTWVCAPPPRGPDKHPNTAGYAAIARAFLAAYRA